MVIVVLKAVQSGHCCIEGWSELSSLYSRMVRVVIVVLKAVQSGHRCIEGCAEWSLLY